MKNLLKLLLVVLAGCGISCEQLGGLGGGSTKTSFDINVSDISATSATVSVTPSNDNTYLFDVIEKDVFNSYGSNAAFMVDIVSLIKSDYKTLADALSSGVDYYTYDGMLTPNTEYYAYAFSVTAEGVITSDLTLKTFKTPAATGGNTGGDDSGNTGGGTSTNTFAISVTNITATDATVSVTPSNNDTYFFDVIEKSVLDQYTDKKEFAAAIVAFYGEEGYTPSQMVSTGSDYYEYEDWFEANTEYYAYAFGLDSNGNITTEVTTKVFTTTASSGGDNGGNTGGGTSTNTFAVTVSDITSSGATVAVAPSNSDTYYFDVIEKSVLDQYTDKKDFATEMVAEIKDYYESNGYTLADALSSGSDSFSYEGYLEPNTDYYAFAVGVSSNGAVTTDVTVKAFTTSASSGGDNGGDNGGNTGGGTSTGDKTLNNFAYGYYTNYGDYYGSGATNWYIDLYTEDTYDVMVIEVQTPTSATDFVGTYQFGNSYAANTAVSYFVDEEGYMCGSYWCLLDSEYNVAEYMPCISGSVTISKSGSNYTIALNALDENGNTLTTNYTGVLEEYVDDYSTMSMKKGFKRGHRTIKAKSNKPSVAKLAPKKILKQPVVRTATPKILFKGATLKNNAPKTLIKKSLK